MKKAAFVITLFLIIFDTAILSAQTVTTFDSQGWTNNQTLAPSFSIGNYTYSSNENFYTNYGYNFDVNSNSLYYVFQDAAADQITVTTANNASFDFNSVDAYQVSETSTDTLIIEGWKNSNKLYSKSFSDVYNWTVLNLNYTDVNKIVIKISPASSTQLTDYNFDNFSYSETALPVELTTFKALTTDNSITLQWQTATEINNYGFDIERTIIPSGVKEGTSSTTNGVEAPVLSPVEAWTKVGFVSGSGNSNSPKSYSFTDKNIADGDKYQYRLKQIDYSGKFIYSNTIEISAKSLPMNYNLSQNYPNPFNPSTKIDYRIPKDGLVVLKVYDILGNEVSTLVDGFKSAGNYFG